MDQSPFTRDSYLFTVRLWAEPAAHESTEWRGQLRLISSGETHYFRDWQSMLALLRSLLPDVDLRAGDEEGK